MDTKTYNVNLKAKKTSWGGLALNLSKNGKLLGGVNKPMDSELALMLTKDKPEVFYFYEYEKWNTMEEIPDEFVLSPDMESCGHAFSVPNVKNIDVSLLDTSRVKDMNAMFSMCQKLQRLDLSNFDVSNVIIFSSVFEDCSELKSVDLTGWNTSNGEYFNSMFYFCGQLEEIKGVIDITKAKNEYANMFVGCSKLKQIKIKATPGQQDNFRSTAQVNSNTEVIFV